MKSCCGSATKTAAGDPLRGLVDQRETFVSFATGKLRDRAVAEDVVQAAFAKAAERIDQLQAAESATAWFYRILRNAIVDHRRRRDARTRAIDAMSAEHPIAAEAVERQPRACRCVSRVVETLKPEYAEALRRVEVEDVSVKDFAVEQNIAANNAAVRVFRAREALRKKVAATCGSCAEGGGCFDCTCAG